MNIPHLLRIIFVAMLLHTIPCGATTIEKTFEFNFARDHQGWEAGFADYPVEGEYKFKLAWGWSNLPVQTLPYGKGLMLSSYNGPDDIFMYVKKKVTGLDPNSIYSVSFKASMATNAPKGCMGVGGAPGESVFFKAGATLIEPMPSIISGDNHYRMNIDKGNQAVGGSDAIVLGSIENNISKCDQFIYEIKTFDNKNTPFVVATGELGEVWLLFGTDSGYEAITTIYLEQLQIRFEKVLP